MPAYVAPRLVITDALGRRTIPIERAVTTFGRRSECDVRLTGADVSRQHAELLMRDGKIVLRDCESKFGTFVNGEKITERELKPGDSIGLGQTSDTSIMFVTGADQLSGEQMANSAALELRHMAALLEGMRALGSGKVLDEVLALVMDSAIEVTGAERGFIMLANADKQLNLMLVRARGKVTLGGKTFETSRKIPETVFATGQQKIVEDLLDGDLASAHMGTVALGIRHVLCAPLRLMRYVESGEQEQRHVIGVLYLDSRERGALRSATVQAALETLSAEAAIAIENARLYREALDKAKIDQELKVAAADSAVAAAAGRSQRLVLHRLRGVRAVPFGRRRLLRLHRHADRRPRLHRRRHRRQGLAGRAAGGGSARDVQRRGVLSDRVVVADHARQCRPVPARHRSAVSDRVLRHPAQGRIAGVHQCRPQPADSRQEKRHHRLEAGGVVLGLFEAATFEQEKVMLEKGDLLLAFSDGVTEAMNEASEEFGDDQSGRADAQPARPGSAKSPRRDSSRK